MSTQKEVVIIVPIGSANQNKIEKQKEKLKKFDVSRLRGLDCKPHFMSASFIATGEEFRQHYAMLEMIVDGSRTEFLKNLSGFEAWRELVHDLFELCEGFPGDAFSSKSEEGGFVKKHSEKIASFLGHHLIRAELFHVGASYRNIDTIIKEREVYSDASSCLKKAYKGSASRNGLWSIVRAKMLERHSGTIESSEDFGLLNHFNLLKPDIRSRYKAYLKFFFVLLIIALAIRTAFELVNGALVVPKWQVVGLILLPGLYWVLGLWASRCEMPKNLKFLFWFKTFSLVAYYTILGVLRISIVLLFLIWAFHTDWPYIFVALERGAMHGLLALFGALATLLGYCYSRWIGAVLAGFASIALWWLALSNSIFDFYTSTYLIIGIELFIYIFVLVYAVKKIRNEELEDAAHKLPEVSSGVTHIPEENVSCQNHMISVTKIREGRFRLKLLVFLMRVVEFFAFYARRGNRGGSDVIQFARFSILPAGKDNYLVFISSFDDGWSSYLGEFNARLLNAVWGNTQGAPTTEFLLWKGAENELAFKRYALSSQFTPVLSFSAYPGVLLRDRHKATEVCQNLKYIANEQTPSLIKIPNKLRRKYLEHYELDLTFRRLL